MYRYPFVTRVTRIKYQNYQHYPRTKSQHKEFTELSAEAPTPAASVTGLPVRSGLTGPLPGCGAAPLSSVFIPSLESQDAGAAVGAPPREPAKRR